MSRLLTDWADIVGSEMAALTRPVRITHGRGGQGGAVLTLLCSGAAAPLVQMQLEVIRRQVNACHGQEAVARIRLTQTAPQSLAPETAGFAEAQAGFASAPTPPKAATGRAVAQARVLTTGIGDADLRAALARLAQNVLSRTD